MILAVVVALLVLAAAGGLIAVLERRPGLLDDRVRKRVIVTLKDGHAFDGVLYAADRDAVVLRNAEGVGMGEKQTNLPVDGEVLILRSDVAYLQLP